LLGGARGLLRYADPLTGIANRFAMLPRLEDELERVRLTGVVSTVSIMHLDRFKRINDSLGHALGDEVLRAVSRHLVKNVRRYDRVARYGGEEFLLLLPDTTPAGAKRVLDRLRRGLSRRTIAVNRETKLTIGASFGVAALDPLHSVMVAIDRADKAMYVAKQAGRTGCAGLEARKRVPGAKRPPPPDATDGLSALCRMARRPSGRTASPGARRNQPSVILNDRRYYREGASFVSRINSSTRARASRAFSSSPRAVYERASMSQP